MHKTASTYIQRRLRKNRSLLKKNGFLLPPRRKIDKELFDNILTENWDSWRRWLKRAKAKNCDLIVSHEALSRLLYQATFDGKIPRGVWLARKLRSCGWKLKVIGFIRDQESYLNSRYTQLVKRLKVRNDFTTYVKDAMEGNTISECDLITLFGWLHGRNKIDRAMIPYGINRNQNGQKFNKKPDPFEQLAEAILLPKSITDKCVQTRLQNQQPGRLGVALALEVNNYLTQNHPEALESHWEQLYECIERIAVMQGWTAEPFNGLNIALRQIIRSRYETSNAEFCRCFWPKTTWDELFNDSRRLSTAIDQEKETESSNAEIKACRNRVINDSLPTKAIIKLPQ